MQLRQIAMDQLNINILARHYIRVTRVFDHSYEYYCAHNIAEGPFFMFILYFR